MSTNYGFLRLRAYTFNQLVSFAEHWKDILNDVPIEVAVADFFNVRYELITNAKRRSIIEMIEAVVCEFYELGIDQVRGKCRRRDLVKARQVIAYLTTKHATQHYIAMVLGNDSRDNIQARKDKCALLMETEPEYVREVESIMELIDVERCKLKIKRDEND